MSNTNTVADYMQKTRAELTAFSGMCNHNGYAYLDDSNCNLTTKLTCRYKSQRNNGRVQQGLGVCPRKA
jgi:hypothetical protein